MKYRAHLKLGDGLIYGPDSYDAWHALQAEDIENSSEEASMYSLLALSRDFPGILFVRTCVPETIQETHEEYIGYFWGGKMQSEPIYRVFPDFDADKLQEVE